MVTNPNASIRTAAFQWLADQVSRHGDVLPRELLAAGFQFQASRVPLLGPQGIFKPQVLSDGPLSITSTPRGPYDDAFGADGLLRYRYRGTDVHHRDNIGLRAAMDGRLPLVYFHGVVPGKYVAAWPVFVVADHPEDFAVSVAVDDAQHMGLPSEDLPVVRQEEGDLRRRYITAAVRVRLHQRSFRERVLEAYQRQCAFCRFRHEEMLDAAHIVPDAHPEGEPLVRNGISLCTLHHSAFDRYFLGLRPDYVIEVRADILREKDGPTLLHGIQALHGNPIVLPRSTAQRPDLVLVQVRYDEFRKAS